MVDRPDEKGLAAAATKSWHGSAAKRPLGDFEQHRGSSTETSRTT